jgi:hypothetical protein
MAILAYIDPGSGSMILQVILASVLAVPFFFRRTIGDVWRRLRGHRDDSSSSSSSTGSGSERSER